MTTSPESMRASAERLCATLERIGDALVTIDAETLLETEETLGQLVAMLGAGGTVDDRAAIKPLVVRAHAALLRCRRLGASYTGIARVRLQMCAGLDSYDRHGSLEQVAPGQAVKAMA